MEDSYFERNIRLFLVKYVLKNNVNFTEMIGYFNRKYRNGNTFKRYKFIMNDIFDNLISLYLRRKKDFLDATIERSIKEEFSNNFTITDTSEPKYDIQNLRLDTFLNPDPTNKIVDKYFLQVFLKLKKNDITVKPSEAPPKHNDSKLALKMWYYIDKELLDNISENPESIVYPSDFKDNSTPNYKKSEYLFFVPCDKLITILKYFIIKNTKKVTTDLKLIKNK